MAKGYVAALVILGLTVVGTFAAAFVLLFVNLIAGVDDTDAYGRVGLPGTGAVELPDGEVSVFYEERGEKVRRPRGNIAYEVRPQGGGPVLASKGPGSVDEEASENGFSRVSFDRIDVPSGGTYLVEAGPVRGDRPSPALTFGEPLTAGILDGVKNAVWGLLGFVLAAAIALITLATTTRSRDETVILPPQGD
ncbi:hypothetical protein BH20ACT15_BH20ACT15_03340 [soil metagenome]